ncbi:hypothetical protein EMIHUDRAFT_253292, partial [Emiliania huxleyi CCMP1516]|uniref:MAM domain-containing protein n=2 Tax=Emiliania huxleyi TaxID=2903 RepID=A0A0D3KA88_EMIH1
MGALMGCLGVSVVALSWRGSTASKTGPDKVQKRSRLAKKIEDMAMAGSTGVCRTQIFFYFFCFVAMVGLCGVTFEAFVVRYTRGRGAAGKARRLVETGLAGAGALRLGRVASLEPSRSAAQVRVAAAALLVGRVAASATDPSGELLPSAAALSPEPPHHGRKLSHCEASGLCGYCSACPTCSGVGGSCSSCCPQRSPPPPSPTPPLLPDMVQLGCDFEVDTCIWNDTAPDGYTWTRTSGGTPSPGTGPSGDHTTGSGYHIFTEATGTYNKLHRLESPRFSLQQDATLSFFYHMYDSYSSDMGTLSVETYNNETGWSTLWSRNGNQGNSWLDAAVILPASTTQVRFNGETGPGWSSDMALDDVSFSQFAPPSLPPLPPSPPPLLPDMVQLSCDFEGDMCVWNDTAPDGYTWTRTSGGTPSPGTGPSGDHTTGSGYYIFTEATGTYNKLHRLESPRFSLQQDATLSFFYHMYDAYSSDMGTLSVETYNNETGWSTLWSRNGNQGNSWLDAAVILPASTTQVRFNGETGPGWSSDMALDDAKLRSLIAEAAVSQADVSIYLPPRADFKLGSHISCGSDINVTVASSGEGATLDGQEQTRLFYLSGGCSLTLRGLTLVNGRTSIYGGVVYADGAGDVEIIESTNGGVVYASSSGAVSIIDSTVRDCSAVSVRRVELAALQRLTAVGREMKRVHGCLTPLSSQPQSGGVVYADQNSGVVSIIDSDVRDCSAGNVRR